jgi:hypothetical protein
VSDRVEVGFGVGVTRPVAFAGVDNGSETRSDDDTLNRWCALLD